MPWNWAVILNRAESFCFWTKSSLIMISIVIGVVTFGLMYLVVYLLHIHILSRISKKKKVDNNIVITKTDIFVKN